MSVDYQGAPEKPPESYRDKVLGVITKHKIACENVLSTTSFDDVLNAVQAESSIPVVVVFDRDGKRHTTFNAGFTYEDDVVPLVEKLLAE